MNKVLNFLKSSWILLILNMQDGRYSVLDPLSSKKNQKHRLMIHQPVPLFFLWPNYLDYSGIMFIFAGALDINRRRNGRTRDVEGW